MICVGADGYVPTWPSAVEVQADKPTHRIEKERDFMIHLGNLNKPTVTTLLLRDRIEKPIEYLVQVEN